MSDSVRPHRWQPTRLPRPWDSPGKNTGVGCHFLLQCMKVKSESEVAQSYSTLSNPMDCSLPGSSVHGIFQARVPEWVAIAFYGHQCILDSKLNLCSVFSINCICISPQRYPGQKIEQSLKDSTEIKNETRTFIPSQINILV